MFNRTLCLLTQELVPEAPPSPSTSVWSASQTTPGAPVTSVRLRSEVSTSSPGEEEEEEETADSSQEEDADGLQLQYLLQPLEATK